MINFQSGSLWAVIYLVQLFIISFALGTILFYCPRLVRIPPISRFLVGFCCAPFFIGGWMILVSAILPGMSRIVFLMPPVIVSILIILRRGYKTCIKIIRHYSALWKKDGNLIIVVIYFAATIIIWRLIITLTINGKAPITGYDASQYLSEALYFAKERALFAINDYHGIGATLRGIIHNFFWQANLGQALMITGDNSLGYPYDYAVRVAFQITIVYMLLAVIALAGTTRKIGIGALSLILLLQVPIFDYISYEASRDAYRIIPLVLLTSVLVGLTPRVLKKKLKLKIFILPVIMAAFSVCGHTLNILPVATITMAWGIWTFIGKARLYKVSFVMVAIGVGMLLSSTHYISAYFETGSIVGNNVYEESSIAGTALANLWAAKQANRLGGAITAFQRILVLLGRDYFLLSIPGLLASIAALFLKKKLRLNNTNDITLFFAIITLTGALLFTDIFGWVGFKMSEWCVMNQRYQLHWYPFAAISVALILNTIYPYLSKSKFFSINVYNELAITIDKNGSDLFRGEIIPNRIFSKQKSLNLKGETSKIGVMLLLVITILSWLSVNSWEIVKVESNTEWLLKAVDPLERILGELPPGQKLLLEDLRYNYYLSDKAILLYTQPTNIVIQAKSTDEVKQALMQLNIGAIALLEANIPGYWDQIPMYDFLNNSGVAHIAYKNERLRIYKIDLGTDISKDALLNIDFIHSQSYEDGFNKPNVYQIKNLGEVLQSKVEEKGIKFKGLMLKRGAKLDINPAGIDLRQGTLSFWVCLQDYRKRYFEDAKKYWPYRGTAKIGSLITYWNENGNRYDLVRVNGNNDLYIYQQQKDGKIAVYYNGVNVAGQSAKICDGKWHNLTFTWRDGRQELFIDSVRVLVDNNPAGMATTQSFVFSGADNNDGGILGSLTTYDYVLSRDDINHLYQNGIE